MRVHLISLGLVDSISESTISKVLGILGYGLHKELVVPLLSDVHKENRISFAGAHWPGFDWRRVVFSDETYIYREKGLGGFGGSEENPWHLLSKMHMTRSLWYGGVSHGKDSQDFASLLTTSMS